MGQLPVAQMYLNGCVWVLIIDPCTHSTQHQRQPTGEGARIVLTQAELNAVHSGLHGCTTGCCQHQAEATGLPWPVLC